MLRLPDEYRTKNVVQNLARLGISPTNIEVKKEEFLEYLETSSEEEILATSHLLSVLGIVGSGNFNHVVHICLMNSYGKLFIQKNAADFVSVFSQTMYSTKDMLALVHKTFENLVGPLNEQELEAHGAKIKAILSLYAEIGAVCSLSKVKDYLEKLKRASPTGDNYDQALKLYKTYISKDEKATWVVIHRLDNLCDLYKKFPQNDVDHVLSLVENYPQRTLGGILRSLVWGDVFQRLLNLGPNALQFFNDHRCVIQEILPADENSISFREVVLFLDMKFKELPQDKYKTLESHILMLFRLIQEKVLKTFAYSRPVSSLLKAVDVYVNSLPEAFSYEELKTGVMKFVGEDKDFAEKREHVVIEALYKFKNFLFLDSFISVCDRVTRECSRDDRKRIFDCMCQFEYSVWYLSQFMKLGLPSTSLVMCIKHMYEKFEGSGINRVHFINLFGEQAAKYAVSFFDVGTSPKAKMTLFSTMIKILVNDEEKIINVCQNLYQSAADNYQKENIIFLLQQDDSYLNFENLEPVYREASESLKIIQADPYVSSIILGELTNISADEIKQINKIVKLLAICFTNCKELRAYCRTHIVQTTIKKIVKDTDLQNMDSQQLIEIGQILSHLFIRHDDPTLRYSLLRHFALLNPTFRNEMLEMLKYTEFQSKKGCGIINGSGKDYVELLLQMPAERREAFKAKVWDDVEEVLACTPKRKISEPICLELAFRIAQISDSVKMKTVLSFLFKYVIMPTYASSPTLLEEMVHALPAIASIPSDQLESATNFASEIEMTYFSLKGVKLLFEDSLNELNFQDFCELAQEARWISSDLQEYSLNLILYLARQISLMSILEKKGAEKRLQFFKVCLASIAALPVVKEIKKGKEVEMPILSFEILGQILRFNLIDMVEEEATREAFYTVSETLNNPLS